MKIRSFIFGVLGVFVIYSGVVVAGGLRQPSQDIVKLDENTVKLLGVFGGVFNEIKQKYVEDTDNTKLIEAAMNGMLSSLDPHSSFLTAQDFAEMRTYTKGEFGGLGLEVTMENGFVKVVSPIDDSPASKAGMKSGDYIVSIDDEAVMGMTLSEAVKQMRGAAGTSVHIAIVREGKNEPIELDLVRETIKTNPVKSKLFDDIGYIRISSFSENTTDGVKTAIEKIKSELASRKLQGLVLDLRNNPGGLLDKAIEVSDLFLSQGEIVSIKGKLENKTFAAKSGDIISGVPMVILINGGSASAAEIVSGALQDNKRAVIMGSRSFGKASVQSIMEIEPYGAIKLTTGKYYTPSGRSLQALGIEPDIEVKDAVVEYSNNESKRLFSESSLKGHLKSEKEKNGKKIDKTENKAQINELIDKVSNNKPIDEKNKNYDYNKDFQLARAIDLLKALSVLSNKKH